MSQIEPVTLKEAQFLLGRPQEELNRAIDRGEVERLTEVISEPAKPGKVKRRVRPKTSRTTRSARTQTTYGLVAPKFVKRTVRKLGQPELLYFSLGRDVHETLTPVGRRKLYEAIRALPPGADAVRIGPFDVKLKAATVSLLKRYRALQDLRAGIVERADEEPVIKGTDISVYMIAALAEGQGITNTLTDYPGLKLRQIERAVDYAQAYPKKGRPYPARSLKRGLAALVDSGALSIEVGEPVELSPDRFR